MNQLLVSAFVRYEEQVEIIQQRQLHEYNNITFDCVLMVLITAKGK